MSIATLGLRSRTGLLTNISFGKSYYDNDARILIERLSLVVVLTSLQKKTINDLILNNQDSKFIWAERTDYRVLGRGKGHINFS